MLVVLVGAGGARSPQYWCSWWDAFAGTLPGGLIRAVSSPCVRQIHVEQGSARLRSPVRAVVPKISWDGAESLVTL